MDRMYAPRRRRFLIEPLVTYLDWEVGTTLTRAVVLQLGSCHAIAEFAP